MTGDSANQAIQNLRLEPLGDPYRDWLRQQVGPALGAQASEQLIQAAVERRGWPAMQPLGPREVMAVIRDLSAAMQERYGEPRAAEWAMQATQDLSVYMQTVPIPAKRRGPKVQKPGQELEAGPELIDQHPTGQDQSDEPSIQVPVRAGRRAHDLPLLLARVHHQTAQRSLDAVRATPELGGLIRAAEWDVQATGAELRRWEAEERLSSLRDEHSRAEMAEQVRSAQAQAHLLDLTVRELEEELAASRRSGQQAGGTSGQANSAQVNPAQVNPVQVHLAHNRLMLTQTLAFLEVFAPFSAVVNASADPKELAEELVYAELLNTDLDAMNLNVGVQLHPNVLRARHALNYAEWQSRDQINTGQMHVDQFNRDSGTHEQRLHRLRECQALLINAEQEAAAQLQAALNTARQHQRQLAPLRPHALELDRRITHLSAAGGDLVSLARLNFEQQQVRAAIRGHANRLQEALRLLKALGL